MMSSFSEKKKPGLKASSKVVVFLLIFVMAFSLLAPTKVAQAQIPVTDALASAWNAGTTVWNKIQKVLGELLRKVGSIAFQQAVRNTLNRVAYDTATWIGSGDDGQKPLYITKKWYDHLGQIGDEAAGDFLQSFVQNLNQPYSAQCQSDLDKCNDSCNKDLEHYSSIGAQFNMKDCLGLCTQSALRCQGSSTGSDGTSLSSFTPSFNVCQPSSIEAKLRIGLGLVEQTRPQGPNCTASEMVKNWGDAASRLTDYQDPNFLDNFSNIFDPRSNDLGIYMTARTDLSSKVFDTREVEGLNLTANKGWTNTTDIAGKLKGLPGESERALEDTEARQRSEFAKVSGDILVDTANVFLNQLALTYYQRLMRNLSNTAEKANSGSGETTSPTGGATAAEGDPNAISYGEGQLKDSLANIIKPSFGVRADYDILSDLTICLDPKSPGPTNCVIDDKFLQGIAEKKTVIEALNEGYLHGDWQLSADTRADSYSLRNLAILRKYRVLPIGWEVAVQKMAANSIKATLMDLVSCFDYTDKYTRFSAEFNVQNQAWCQGLVDPNWVLKAPLNYCKKEGVGGQVLNKYVTPGIKGSGGTADTLSALSIVRGEEYCADDQSCIKEKDDGSCEAYGYCNEEKRIWKFNAESCEPINNTCQAFISPNDGQVVAYLENTLDYGDCNADSAGCRQYALFGAYASSSGAVAWNSSSAKYFNKHLSGCREEDEGCTELLRLKPTWGSNLVLNSDFQADEVGDTTTGSFLNNWPVFATGNNHTASIVDAYTELGGSVGKILKLETSGGSNIMVETFSNHNDSLVPDNLQVIPGYSYTLSADVYLTKGDKVQVVLGAEDYQVYGQVSEKDAWKHVSVTRTPVDGFNDPSFIIAGYAVSGDIVFYVKNIKLEISDWDTGYSVYGSFKTYEKLLPPYLEQSCYQDVDSTNKDYRLKANAPEVCSQFARRCNKDEVNCELYSGVNDVFAVPAKVTSGDYCPGECLGYDVYIAKTSYFNSPQAENLIPDKSQGCRAEAAGCNAFTNLDALGQGGEQLEYYTTLKQCILPDPAQCGDFYSWEGTENGYQLKVYSLRKTGTVPYVPNYNAAECNADIFQLPPSDPSYNPDCREFYSVSGLVSYRLLSQTVTCSANCHPYRLAENNYDQTVTQQQCEDDETGSMHWDPSRVACVVCLNGGEWNQANQACVYQAIPGEGKTCTAAENGCREYNGNNGSNVQIIASYDFESGLNGWHANCVNGVSLSTISNTKDGHSLMYNDGASSCASVGENNVQSTRRPLIERVLAGQNEAAQLKVGTGVKEGAAYNLKFLAKAASNVNVDIYFLNATTDETAHFNATSPLTITGDNQWGIYQVNLDNLNHKVGEQEFLIITASGDFYFDNIVLTEITDRYYLIKNTSQIPNVCYYDIFDNYQGTDYNLGCSQYTDRSGLIHNLRQFSQLCADSSVGCEQLLNTQNYTPAASGVWRDLNENGVCDSNEPDCVTVPGDSALYAIFDPAKQCNSADLGCSRLGQDQNTGSGVDWLDVFAKNNPNQYNQILCGSSEVGCEEWRNADNNQSSYFKDPGNNTCSYRDSQDPTSPGKAWYKIPVKRCDNNSSGQIEGNEKGTAVCASVADCNNKPCILDNNDYLCTVSYLKTIGLGGGGNQVPVPDSSAGLCEANSSGCTEYIDPVSQFSPNLLYNPQMLNGAEGWSLFDCGGGPGCGDPYITGNFSYFYYQEIKLEPNKLYIFQVPSAVNNSTEVSLTFNSLAKPLLSNNTFGTSTNNFLITGYSKPLIFHTLSNTKATVRFGTNTYISPGSNASGPVTVNIRSLVIDYQNRNNVDKQSCNGKVEFDNGCILFNERSINGGQGLFDLKNSWDAYATLDRQAPENCNSSQAGSCTANQLIKVRPDRVCAKWFDCLTYVKDPETNERTCYAIGECDRLNDKNECANFLSGDQATSTNFFDSEKDKNSSGYALLDKYYFSQMKEVGLNAEAHFDFEDSAPAVYCQKAGTTNACNFSKGILKETLVREPEGAPTDYPAQGKSFLKVPSAYEIMPHSKSVVIPVVKSTDLANPVYYYLNYLVNTKGSGLAARVQINFVNASGNPVAGVSPITQDVTANYGWERKIFRFYVPDNSAVKGVQIVLRSTDPSKDGFIYFDDLHIEPVLQVGDNNYAAKECRLYPTSDSLTCTNKDSNVIRDGLEGYCLEHDPDNPSVCLLWYPVDQIGASKINRSSLGYQGKFPLSYCTEASGDFEVMEKREAYVAAVEGCDLHNMIYSTCYFSTSDAGGNNSEAFRETNGSWYCWQGGGTRIQSPTAIQNICGSDMVGKYWAYRRQHNGYYVYFCVPAYLNEWGMNGSKNVLYSKGEEISVSGTWCHAEQTVPMTWPREAGWFKYDGLDNNDSDYFCGSWPINCYKYDEAKLANPPVRIYDYRNPPVDEDSMKLIADSDQDKVFQLTCNRFTQVVDSNGSNYAWAGRTGVNSADPLDTPPYFIDLLTSQYFGKTSTSIHKINKYGRNREEAPFGAAVWPDDFNLLSSQKIELRDQYSEKNNEDIFAGRPYGCAASTTIVKNGGGCLNIGYCSLDPSVYCVYYPGAYDAVFNLNGLSCGKEGYGVCQPLWNQYLREGLGNLVDDKDILRTLFLKSYNNYSYNYTNQGYDISPAGAYNETNPSGVLPECQNSVRLLQSYSNPSPLMSGSRPSDFCAVYPEIDNIRLRVAATDEEIQRDELTYFYTLPAAGVYRFSFTSTIDKEQQPLKLIYIDWGDGNQQVISGQDSHSDPANPHSIYHFYKKGDMVKISIAIYDNWWRFAGCTNGVCINPFGI